MLRRRLGSLSEATLARSLLRTVIATVPVLLWCLWLRPAGAGTWTMIGSMLGAVGGGLALYAGASALLRAPELDALAAVVRRKGRTLP